MSDDHDGVPELLAAWALGALHPADERAVPPHLAGCGSCAAEAERLRETVRLLDGPPGVPEPAVPGGGAGPDGVVAFALRARPAAPRVAAHAAPYAAAVCSLTALLREVDGHRPWGTPVVHDWDVRDTVGHLIAADEGLARGLGVRTHAPPSRITRDTGWEEAWEARTAEVVAYERTRSPHRTVAAWSAQSAALLATAEALDAGRAARVMELTGVRLPVADHFLARAFETWIHTDDVGRALGLAVPPPPGEHLGQLVRLAVRLLGPALGPAAAPVVFAVPDAGDDARWVLGAGDEPVRGELALRAVDFCLLVGGRHTPASVPRSTTGDPAAVRNVLERAASLAWL